MKRLRAVFHPLLGLLFLAASKQLAVRSITVCGQYIRTWLNLINGRCPGLVINLINPRLGWYINHQCDKPAAITNVKYCIYIVGHEAVPSSNWCPIIRPPDSIYEQMASNHLRLIKIPVND